jgi:membrane fusion protein, multidrug efflux system
MKPENKKIYKMKSAVYIFIAVMLFTAGCGNQEQSLQADVEIPVSVTDIRLGSIEEIISTTGTVYPKGVIELKAKISATYYPGTNPRTGRIWQLGDRVAIGDVLARLEDKEFENSVKLEAQELNLELTESELQKQNSLYEKGGVTLKDVKSAGYNYVNAKYSVENARLQIQKMKVVSTISGVIVDLPYYTPGTQIDNNVPIAKIMDYKTMYLDVNIPEKYITQIISSQPVRLTNYTLPDDTIKGIVSQTSPAIDAESRTFKAVITGENDQLLLRPGMFVKADILINKKDSVVVIPKEIILSRQRGKTVFVVDRGVAMERIITTGLENNSEVEVLSGLVKEERLVTSGYETLSNRSRVKIIR